MSLLTDNNVQYTKPHDMTQTAKAEELHKDIGVMSQTFERVVDRKDAIIQSLARDLEEAEEQYQVALRAHFQNVDDLIGKWAGIYCCVCLLLLQVLWF